jgi:surfeit locus 1 family protein
MAKSGIVTARSSDGKKSLIAPSLAAAMVFAILIGLGLWQIERLAWKERLIANMQARLAAPPAALPDAADWPKLSPEKDEFRRVTLRAEFPESGNSNSSARRAYLYAGAPALRPDIKTPGYFVFAPARLADGRIVVVNIGWVPLDRRDATWQTTWQTGPREIIGFLRWPERSSPFVADHDAAGEIWFRRDPAGMAAMLQWGEVAPFHLDMEGPVPSGGLPKPGLLAATLPNNHLGYALTWFGLAGTLAGVFGFWLRARYRGTANTGARAS